MTAQEKNTIKQHLSELSEWVDEQAYSQSEQEAAANTIEALEKEVADLSTKIGTIHEAMKAMHRVWFDLYESAYLSVDRREEYKHMVLAMVCALELFKSEEHARQALEQYSKLI